MTMTSPIFSEEIRRRRARRAFDKGLCEIDLFGRTCDPLYWWPSAIEYPVLAMQGPFWEQMTANEAQWQAEERVHAFRWVIQSMDDGCLPREELTPILVRFAWKAVAHFDGRYDQALTALEQQLAGQLTQKEYLRKLAYLPRERHEPLASFQAWLRDPWHTVSIEALDAIHSILLSNPRLSNDELCCIGTWEWRTLVTAANHFR